MSKKASSVKNILPKAGTKLSKAETKRIQLLECDHCTVINTAKLLAPFYIMMFKMDNAVIDSFFLNVNVEAIELLRKLNEKVIKKYVEPLAKIHKKKMEVNKDYKKFMDDGGMAIQAMHTLLYQLLPKIVVDLEIYGPDFRNEMLYHQEMKNKIVNITNQSLNMSGGSNNVPTIDKKYLSSSEVPKGTRVEAYYDFNVSDHDNYYIDPGTGDIVKYDGKHKVFETFNQGEAFTVIDSPNNKETDHVLARRDSDGSVGFVPWNYIIKIESETNMPSLGQLLQARGNANANARSKSFSRSETASSNNSNKEFERKTGMSMAVFQKMINNHKKEKNSKKKATKQALKKAEKEQKRAEMKRKMELKRHQRLKENANSYSQGLELALAEAEAGETNSRMLRRRHIGEEEGRLLSAPEAMAGIFQREMTNVVKSYEENIWSNEGTRSLVQRIKRFISGKDEELEAEWEQLIKKEEDAIYKQKFADCIEMMENDLKRDWLVNVAEGVGQIGILGCTAAQISSCVQEYIDQTDQQIQDQRN